MQSPSPRISRQSVVAKRFSLRRGLLLTALLLVVLALALRATRRVAGPNYRALSTSSLQSLTHAHPDDVPAMLALGERLQQSGQVAEAHALLEQAATRTDDEAVWLAWAATANGPTGPNDTRLILTEYLKGHPDSASAHLALGQAHRQAGRHQEAYQQAQSAVKLAPQQPDAWKLLGSEAAALGDVTQAETALQQALRLRPDDWRTRFGLGDVLLLHNQTLAALDCFRQASDLASGDPLAQSVAEQSYRAALRVVPESPQANEGVGRALAAQGRREDAFPYLDAATRRNPDLPDAQLLLGTWFADVGLAKEAAQRLERVVRMQPSNAAAWHQLGLAYGRQEVANQQALTAFGRAVTLDGQQPEYQLDLADVLATEGRATEAEAAYRRAAALAPHSADALSRLGAFLMNSASAVGREQEARTLLEQALAADPQNDFACYHLGQLALRRGEYVQALPFLTRAAQINPGVAEIWYSLSQAYQRGGDTKRARLAREEFARLRRSYAERSHTSELVGLHPQDATLRLKMAHLYAQNGENAKAIDQYLHCLRLDPNLKTASQELQALQTRLKAAGHLPNMTLFYALVRSAARNGG